MNSKNRFVVTKFVASVVVISTLSVSTAYAWSWKGALKGALVTGVFGSPLSGFIAGGAAGETAVDSVVDSGLADLQDFTDKVGDIRNEVYSGVTDVLTKGINYLGMGQIFEELLYISYKEVMYKQLSENSSDLPQNPNFVARFRANYQQFYDVPIEQVVFREFNGGWFDLNDLNAVTDCKVVYVPVGSALRHVVDGTTAFGTAGSTGDAWKWLLHELKHAEQCDDLGSRRAYGVYWWENVIAVSGVSQAQLATGDVGGALGRYKDFHNNMPMEKDAEAFALAVLPGAATLTATPNSTKLVGRSTQRAIIVGIVTHGLL